MSNEQEVQAVPRDSTAVRPAVEIANLSKSFPGTQALAGFDLEITPGEVHVLVGANGSGKSTLIKVLSGFHTPDSGGEVLINGQSLSFGSGEQSYRLGCRFVHQDLGLVATLSVLDNLHLGNFPTRAGTIRGGPLAARPGACSRRSGSTSIPPCWFRSWVQLNAPEWPWLEP